MPFLIILLAGTSLGALGGAALLVLLDLATRNAKRARASDGRSPSGCWAAVLGGWVGGVLGTAFTLNWHGLRAEPALVGGGLLLAAAALAVAWAEAQLIQPGSGRRGFHFLDSLLQLTLLSPLPWAVMLLSAGLARWLR